MYFQWYITFVFLDIPSVVSVYGQLHMHTFVKDMKEEGRNSSRVDGLGFTVLRNRITWKSMKPT